MRPGQGRAWAATQRRVRRLLRAELRQVHEHDLRRAPDRRPRQAHGARRLRRQRRTPRGPAAPPRCARDLGVGDAGDPVVDQPPVVGELDDVAGIEREPRGRQREGGGLAADPGLGERAAGSAGRPPPAARRAGRISAVTRAEPAVIRRGLDDGDVVLLVGPRHRPLQHLRQLGLLRAGQLQDLATRRPGRSPRPCRPARPPPTGPRSRMTKRITPSLSTASKPKCRASVAIEARGLSSAVTRQPSTAPQRPETSMRSSGRPARRQRSRTSAASETAPSRPVSQCPSRQFGPSVQTSPSSGKNG